MNQVTKFLTNFNRKKGFINVSKESAFFFIKDMMQDRVSTIYIDKTNNNDKLKLKSITKVFNKVPTRVLREQKELKHFQGQLVKDRLNELHNKKKFLESKLDKFKEW